MTSLFSGLCPKKSLCDIIVTKMYENYRQYVDREELKRLQVCMEKDKENYDLIGLLMFMTRHSISLINKGGGAILFLKEKRHNYSACTIPNYIIFYVRSNSNFQLFQI